jgi:hypothetical protein
MISKLLLGTFLVGSSGDLGLRTGAAASAATVATALLAVASSASSSTVVIASSTHIEDEDGRWKKKMEDEGRVDELGGSVSGRALLEALRVVLVLVRSFAGASNCCRRRYYGCT